MELTEKEKIAFLYTLKEMMVADGVVADQEIMFINRFACMRDVDVGQHEFNQAMAMSEHEAMLILSAMSEEKRRLVLFLLRDIARTDGKVDINERAFWIKIKSILNITDIDDI